MKAPARSPVGSPIGLYKLDEAELARRLQAMFDGIRARPIDWNKLLLVSTRKPNQDKDQEDQTDEDANDLTRVMGGMLNPGATRRLLGMVDQIELEELYSASSPWTASFPRQAVGRSRRAGLEYEAHALVAVPEPASLGLLMLGGLALIQRRR